MNHLTTQEKKAVHLFKERLFAIFSDRMQDIKLFGSKTRGDATKFSDVDILVVLKDGTWRDSWPIHQIASSVSLQSDIDLSVKITTADGIKRLRQNGSPLIANIDREGVSI